ncbi:ATP-binding protein [Streptomyces sp. NPDC059631]|uniref:ATP-binding protein n=1 Tax=unclassified Streptomyces TaxID=2593676 RepID=UPI00368C6DF3
MQRGEGSSNLRITDHATVDKAVLIGHAGHVSLGGDLKQRRRPLQVPRDIPEFTGRKELLSEIEQSLSSNLDAPAIWVLSGMAGVGKTSIAIRSANKYAEVFPDGILYARLAGASTTPADPADILTRFLRDLGVPIGEIPGDYESLVTAYRTLVATRAILVVLDDAANTAQVNDLIPTSPSSAALITSRRPLATLPGAQSLPVDVWTEDESVEFLRMLLGSPRIDAKVDEVRELANMCGRLPIALRIIGAQLIRRSLWPLARMTSRLRDEQRRLEMLKADDIAIRSVFATAYDSLDEEQSRIFRNVGLTLGLTFSAESVAKLADSDEYFTEELLEDLADRHLITPEDVPGRFRIHDLMRLFAREKAAEQGSPAQTDASFRRLLEWHLKVLTSDSPSVRSWVRLERNSLVAGVLLANERLWDELCWQTANALASYHFTERECSDWIVCNQAGLAAARRNGSHRGEALMLAGLGQASRQLSKLNDSRSHLEASLQIFRQIGDLHRYARILWEIGNTASRQWDVGRAISVYSESVEMYTVLGAKPGVAKALHALGHLYTEIGRHNEALGCFEREMRLAAQSNAGSKYMGVAYQGMASCLAAAGMHEKAISSYDKAIAQARLSDDMKAVRIRLTRKAKVLQRMGADEAANNTYEEALTLSRQINDTSGIAYILHALADNAERKGDHAKADLLYAEILDVDGIEEKPIDLINTLHCWADSLQERGEVDRSAKLLDRAITIARQSEEEPELVQVLLCRSGANRKRGNVDDALLYARDAVAVARSYGSARILAQCLNSLGNSLRESQQDEDAADVFAEQLRLEVLMQQHDKAYRIAARLSALWESLGDTEKARLYTVKASEFAAESEKITAQPASPLKPSDNP